MGSGFRTFASGEVLTAANVNNYLMEQAVMSFADSTARDAAVTSPEEGMTAYLQDSNSVTVYSGSAWVTIADLEVLIVDSTNGRVGILDTTPSYNLDVNGSEDTASRININSGNTANRYLMRFSRNDSLFSSGIYCDTSQAYFGTPSDANLKTDIETIPTPDALATLNELKPVTYRFLTDPDDVVRRGFIAQEVEQILPEAVHRVGQDDDIVLTWEPITTTAVAAVQELLSLVNTLTARIEVLESQ